MIKLTFCLVRLPHLSREEFQSYWYNQHGPLVASVKEALKIRRYVQTHSLPVEVADSLRTTRDAPAGYDGVAQLWWDSFADMARPGDADAAKASQLLLEDERTFIDLPKSPLWWGTERSVIG